MELVDRAVAFILEERAYPCAELYAADTFPIEEFQQVMDINTMGTFICSQAVGRVMIKQGKGRIINLSSVRGQYGLKADYAAYCSSKGAVDTMTKTLACEWATG